MINISVVITPFDDDGSVAVPMITVADDVAVAVPVTISVTLTNRYPNGANTNAHLSRSSRRCAENSGDGGDHYGILNHCVFLSLLSSGKAMPGRWVRSGLRLEPGGNKRAQDGAPMLYVRLHCGADGLALEYEQQTAYRHLVPPPASPADSAIRKSE
jgi:hypothetical protein